MKPPLRSLIFLCPLAFCASGYTQDASATLTSNPLVQSELKNAANTIVNATHTPGLKDPSMQIGANLGELVSLSFEVAHYDAGKHVFQAAVATASTKTQVGSPASSGASTSLIQKPLLPTLLGVAVENGAVLDDVNENTLTLSSSPYALIASIVGDTDSTYASYGGYTRFGVTASFRITDTTVPLASTSRKQLSNWGATFRITKDVSARSQAAIQRFETDIRPTQQEAANASSGLQHALANDKALNDAEEKFTADAVPKIRGALANSAGKTDADLASVLERVIEPLFKEDLAPAILASKLRPDAEVASYENATKALLTSTPKFLQDVNSLASSSAASLFYNFQQPTGATSYSEVGMSYAGSPKGYGGDLTVNALVSFYTKPDKTLNQETFRAASGSFQMSIKLKRSPFLSNASDQSPITAALSGRYQRLQENEHVQGKKADIGEGNFKLEIPIAGGLSLPLSATFANAGQTIAESYIRGNFGISFDLDKLSLLLKQ